MLRTRPHRFRGGPPGRRYPVAQSRLGALFRAGDVCLLDAVGSPRADQMSSAPRGSARARHPCRPPRGIKRCQASCRSVAAPPSAAGAARTPSFPACANCCKRWRVQTRDVERDDNGSCDRSPVGAPALAKPSNSVAFTAQDSLLMRRARRTARTSPHGAVVTRWTSECSPSPGRFGMAPRDHQPNRAICATNCNQERPAVKTYLLEDTQLGNARDLTRGNDAR